MATREIPGERRRRSRASRSVHVGQEVKLSYLSANGITVVVPGVLFEITDDGCSIDLNQPVELGLLGTLTGKLEPQGEHRVRGRVTWCRLRSLKTHRAGVQFLEPVQRVSSEYAQSKPAANGQAGDGTLPDYYEVLQLGRNADTDTIHRVYRMLAQRYHPDNTESGSAERFRQVLEAYRALSDPEQRAAYDAIHLDTQRVRWRIFDQNTSIDEFEAEKAKRKGVLALLYRKRVTSPREPTMSLQDIEDLLAVPREHLEFTFWFLRENNWVIRSDNGRFAVTVQGVEQLERTGVPRMNPSKLITGATVKSEAA
jgi:DnaJ domain/PilZ domain